MGILREALNVSSLQEAPEGAVAVSVLPLWLRVNGDWEEN